MQAARYIYEGFSSVLKLSDNEIGLIYDIILCRFVLSVTCGHKTIKLGEANQYVHQCVDYNMKFIKKFVELGKEKFDKFVLE